LLLHCRSIVHFCSANSRICADARNHGDTAESAGCVLQTASASGIPLRHITHGRAQGADAAAACTRTAKPSILRVVSCWWEACAGADVKARHSVISVRVRVKFRGACICSPYGVHDAPWPHASIAASWHPVQMLSNAVVGSSGAGGCLLPPDMAQAPFTRAYAASGGKHTGCNR
jgi:hypothetical protein